MTDFAGDLERLERRLVAVEQVNVRFLALEVEVRGVSDDVKSLANSVSELVKLQRDDRDRVVAMREADRAERKRDNRWIATFVSSALVVITGVLTLVVDKT